MSWASQRRATYAFGVFLFFAILIGGPAAYWYFSIPPSCQDGIQNQGETAIDRGGPCPLLDTRAVQDASLLWARSFLVRPGVYNAVAHIQNANEHAGVRSVRYTFTFYDERNVFVAERSGETYLMPSAVTPVFESTIPSGNRTIAHTYFEFTEAPKWERLVNVARVIQINDRALSDVSTVPRLSASATNTSVEDLFDVVLSATIYDPAGNAFAASETTIAKLRAGESQEIVFTWPNPFLVAVGRIDIIPTVLPTYDDVR